MTYFAPYIDAAGLHIPTYLDIENYYVQRARDIFGADIYLENDSQDFQFIAAISQATYDTLLTAQLAYNSHSPISSIGTGLDAICDITGIARNGQTFSTADVQLTGDPFTTIINGFVADINGNQWNLPGTVVLSDVGENTVTATAQVSGPIFAQAGQINIIVTPTAGWVSVINPLDAVPGESVETDSHLRTRRELSVANPSQAITTGILGAVLEVANVVNANIYENDTNDLVYSINGVINPDLYPPHSITMVVEGGDENNIASAIALRKTAGAYTNGDIIIPIIDQYGVSTPIRFFRPINTLISISITVYALQGFNSVIGNQILTNMINYVNSLSSGTNIIISELEQAALDAITDRKKPTFSIHFLGAAIVPNAPLNQDVVMTFKQKPITNLANVVITVV